MDGINNNDFYFVSLSRDVLFVIALHSVLTGSIYLFCPSWLPKTKIGIVELTIVLHSIKREAFKKGE